MVIVVGSYLLATAAFPVCLHVVWLVELTFRELLGDFIITTTFCPGEGFPHSSHICRMKDFAMLCSLNTCRG